MFSKWAHDMKGPVRNIPHSWSYTAHIENMGKSLSMVRFEKNRAPVQLKEFVLQIKLKAVSYRKISLLVTSFLVCSLPPLRLLSGSKLSIRCPLLTGNIIFDFDQWNTKIMLPACSSVSLLFCFFFLSIETVDYNTVSVSVRKKEPTKPHCKHNTEPLPSVITKLACKISSLVYFKRFFDMMFM